MVSEPDKEYTKYDNIKTGKPFTKKELSLPSLIPELVDPKESELCFSPAIKRLHNLPKIAFSTLVHAHTNHASLDEKYRLRKAFTVECLEAMHAVTAFASACQNNDPQSRNDFIEKYRSWELRLRQIFEQWLLGKNGHCPGAYLDHNPFFKLLKEQDVLHRKALMMATIEAEHSESGEFVSGLIRLKSDPAKKPAEAGQRDSQNAGHLKPTVNDIKALIQQAERLKQEVEQLKKKRFLTPVQSEAIKTGKTGIDIALYLLQLSYTNEEECENNFGIVNSYFTLTGSLKSGRFAQNLGSRYADDYGEEPERIEWYNPKKHTRLFVRYDFDEKKFRRFLNQYAAKQRSLYRKNHIQPLIVQLDTDLTPWLPFMKPYADTEGLQEAIKTAEPVTLSEAIYKFKKIQKVVETEVEQEPAETGQGNNESAEKTPKTDSNLIYQSDAAEFYNIPKSTLSKDGRKTPGEPGYLWSGIDGRRRFYRKADLEKISRSRQKLKDV